MRAELHSLFNSRSAFAVAGICGLVLVVKFLLVFRMNVNWDEFIYLSYIYEFERGDLGTRFQTAYVHLFNWLTDVAGGEMTQIALARLVMFSLLLASVVLLARLARQWVSAPVAWIAPLTFLSALPVLRHSASFRADSILLPLMLLACVCVVSQSVDARRIAVAGAALGASLAISLKAVLIAPLLAMLLLTNPAIQCADIAGRSRAVCGRLGLFVVCTGATAGLLLTLHWWTLPTSDSTTISGFASGVAQKTVVDVPFFPRWDYFSRSLQQDWLVWASIGAGAVASLFGSWRVALLALSLLPLLFYRNAFPYYYAVMLAPASVLACLAVERLRRLTEQGKRDGDWLPLIVSMPLAFQAGLNLAELSRDGQDNQRAMIDAVHQIFPEPVPYIDHSGMIASFPKVNSLMSSWAIENYRRRGIGFMAAAIDSHRPPMLLANAPVLMPGAAAFEQLLEEDRDAIEQFYLPYWGAVRVAGAEAVLEPHVASSLEVPFPGRYRLEADESVVLGGAPHESGDEIFFPEGDPPYSVAAVSNTGQLIRLVWAEAEAGPRPVLPPFVRLYAEL